MGPRRFLRQPVHPLVLSMPGGAGACPYIHAARRTSYQPTLDAVDSAKAI